MIKETPQASASVWAAYDAETDLEVQEGMAILVRFLAETCGVLDPGWWVTGCKQLATMTFRSLHKVPPLSCL